MRKLLALPKFLAVLTVAAATLLLVGAASAELVYSQCPYYNNGVLVCYGQETQGGSWILVITYRIADIPASYGVDPLPQYQEEIYVWNGSQWVLVTINQYSLIAGASQPYAWPSYEAWFHCRYSNLSPYWWTASGSLIIVNDCGPPPSSP